MLQQLGLRGRFCDKNSVDNFYVDVVSFWPADELCAYFRFKTNGFEKQKVIKERNIELCLQ